MNNNTLNIPTPPGATIAEQIEYQKMTKEDFCRTMELSEKDYQKLICGELNITENIALKL